MGPKIELFSRELPPRPARRIAPRHVRQCLLPLLLLALATDDASAMCNVIPAATRDFRGALGSANRPFAGPGEYVEVRVRPPICDGASTGFVDLDGDGDVEDDYVVTVLFVPPGVSPPLTQGTANAVVLAEDCTGLDLASCDAELGAGTVECVQVNLGGQPVGLSVESARALQLRFPDTDHRLAPAADDRTFAGPAKIVVSRRGHPLPCGLATQRCADLGGDTATNGVAACIDELYELDGTCRTLPANVDATFSHFTGLPPPNDFLAMKDAPGITEVRLTADRDGHALVPMDYIGVLLRQSGIPIPQIVRATTGLDAFGGSPGQPVVLPGDGVIASYSPEGVILPPVFTPLSGDPGEPSPAILFGSVDAPRGVIRVASRACQGGSNAGGVCRDDGDCPGGGSCAALFELRDRFESGVGPVVVPIGEYTAEVELSVPLEGLFDGDEAFAFVLSEAVDGVDRNGDADATDFVSTLRDRETGVEQLIGPLVGQDQAQGLAVTRVREPPFAFPAVETADDLLVLLLSEPGQGAASDENANGEIFDSVLRVFRLGAGGQGATEVTPGTPITVDAAPLVNGRSTALSEGLVFFRTREAEEASQTTVNASVDSGGGASDAGSEGAIAAGGGHVALESDASDLVAGDTNGRRDVFVRDLAGGTTERVSVSSAGGQIPNTAWSEDPSISRDGRYVAFTSDANLLVDPPVLGTLQIWRRDRILDTTVLVSEAHAGGPGNNFSGVGSVSDDGRFVAFVSQATNLLAVPPPGAFPFQEIVYVRDLDAETTVLVSVNSDGELGDNHAYTPKISSDGRFVAFASSASNLVEDEGSSFLGIFLHDRDADEDGVFDEPGAIATERVSVASDGTPEDADSFLAHYRDLSDDGRFVTFSSDATNLVSGDTNGVRDVFLRDRVARVTTRVSVAADGTQGNGASGSQPFSLFTGSSAISGEGRFVGFSSDASNLVAGDGNGATSDAFVVDRLTGHLRVASRDPGGSQVAQPSLGPTLTERGTEVALPSQGALTPVQGPGMNVFVRRADPGDLSADRSGDGELDDELLRVLDTTVGPPGAVTDLCPAEAVAVAGGRAAFLRPEAAGATSNAACTGPDLGGPNLNGDGDAGDTVVHLYSASAVANLRCAATAVALSETRLAALVSECGQGGAETDGCPAPGGTDLDGDGAAADRVLFARAVAAPVPAGCIGTNWTQTQHAGDAIALSGDTIVLMTREGEQGSGVDLSGDGDTSDRVIRLVDGASGALVPIVDAQVQPDAPQPAEEFVAGTNFVAFRTGECDAGGAIQSAACPAGGSDLNGDSDAADHVLQLYVLATGERINTGQAVLPCRLVACEPERPYRVSDDTLRFLTLEADQGEDLNDDGDQDDLLVQVYNVAAREARVVAEVADTGATVEDPENGVDPLAAPDPTEGGAGGEQVLITRGRCVVEDPADPCTLGDPASCDAGEFCFDPPDPPMSPPVAPRCVRDTGATCMPDRAPGEQGCAADASCIEDFTVIGVADADRDEVPDGLDNCPALSNVGQADLDQDGAGDACDLETCSNGLGELAEECDDADLADGDGCDSNCRVTACGNGLRTGAEECDDGNGIEGDGCTTACGIEPVDVWAFDGVAVGGSVGFEVDGIAFTVETEAGDGAAEVAEKVVAAMRASQQLAAAGIYAASQGSLVVSNAAIADRSISDAGLVAPVPALSPWAVGALLALLAGTAAATLRKAGRDR